MRRPVVVVYDIGDDRRRARVRALLGPVADRFQRSGWLVPAEMGLSASTVLALLRSAAEPTDRLRAYGPCRACARQARRLPTRQPHTLDTIDGWTVS